MAQRFEGFHIKPSRNEQPPQKKNKVANLGLLLESDPLNPISCFIASKFNIKTTRHALHICIKRQGVGLELTFLKEALDSRLV
jgi:hypothetical protein